MAEKYIVTDPERSRIWYTIKEADCGPLDMVTYIRKDLHDEELEKAYEECNRLRMERFEFAQEITRLRKCMNS